MHQFQKKSERNILNNSVIIHKEIIMAKKVFERTKPHMNVGKTAYERGNDGSH
jgi:hypothetical protein